MACACNWIRIVATSSTKNGVLRICAAGEKNEQGEPVLPPTKYFEIEEFHQASPRRLMRTTFHLPLTHVMPLSDADDFECPLPTVEILDGEGDENNEYTQRGEEVTPEDAMEELREFVENGEAEEVETVLTVFGLGSDDEADWGSAESWHLLCSQPAPASPSALAQQSVGLDTYLLQESEVKFKMTGGIIPALVTFDVVQYDETMTEIDRADHSVPLIGVGETDAIPVKCEGDASVLARIENVRITVPYLGS